MAIKWLTHMCAKWRTWLAVTGLVVVVYTSGLVFFVLKHNAHPLREVVARYESSVGVLSFPRFCFPRRKISETGLHGEFLSESVTVGKRYGKFDGGFYWVVNFPTGIWYPPVHGISKIFALSGGRGGQYGNINGMRDRVTDCYSAAKLYVCDLNRPVNTGGSYMPSIAKNYFDVSITNPRRVFTAFSLVP
jgi:hypothetical protein